MQSISEKVTTLGLEEDIKFLGLRSDVPDLLQVMDIFMLPSLYEGFPVSMVEAQTAGLKCIISDKVPADCILTDLVEQLSLSLSAEEWADKILSTEVGHRENFKAAIVNAGYDIDNNAEYLQDYYISKYKHGWDDMNYSDNLKETIKKDLYRYIGNNNIDFISKNRLYGWHYLKTWRKANYYLGKNKILYLIYGFLLYRKSLKYGFQISPQAKIGDGLYLGHFGTVIVGNEVEIGNNVNLNPNVVIGRENRGARKGSPKLGNEVWVGTGSIIVGKIIIGNNVLIAPNSYVNFDVPDNSIVIGNPGVIKENNSATDDYVCNIVE